MLHGIDLRLSQTVVADDLQDFDAVVLATGVVPRIPALPGIDHPSVISYAELLSGMRKADARVAILGAGGIGFDVAHYLLQDPPSTALDPARWYAEWGIDPHFKVRGGIEGFTPRPEPSRRELWLLQRSKSRHGQRLGKTTGWIHRTVLKRAGVRMLSGIEYLGIDDAGLHLQSEGQLHLLAVDSIVLCTGQESECSLLAPLQARGMPVHVIGGAALAAELDARRAIAQGCELAARL